MSVGEFTFDREGNFTTIRHRRGCWASLWVFDPTDGGCDNPQVEAMPAKVEVSRSDEDRIVVTVRGKPKAKGRYEPDDSVWLEMTDADAVKLVEQVAKALTTSSSDT